MIVVFSEARDRFECVASYAERDMARLAGFRWDKIVKRWHAREEAVARRLAEYATGSAALRLNALGPAERQAMADSQAQDAPADLDIPVPAGLAYLPYQRAGIAYMLARFGDLRSAKAEKGGSTPSRGGVLLADEMG